MIGSQLSTTIRVYPSDFDAKFTKKKPFAGKMQKTNDFHSLKSADIDFSWNYEYEWITEIQFNKRGSERNGYFFVMKNNIIHLSHHVL